MSDAYQTRKRVEEIADYVMRCGQLAAALEVCGWPKPGNVHRTANFPDTRFEHFIAGSVSMGPALREAAVRGVMARLGEARMDELGVGRLIRRAVADMKAWHRGGNTHLGTCILFIPLAASAGKTYIEQGRITSEKLRSNTVIMTRNTTSIDAVNVYEAIRIAGTERTLGEAKVPEAPDVFDEGAEDKLISEKVTLYDAMKIASEWDKVASEFTSGMETVFELGYPSIVEILESTGDINTAIVHSYLKVLHEFPDTFMARKIGLKETGDIKAAVKKGLEKVLWISREAGKILEDGGLMTEKGRETIKSLDDRLHEAGGELNPGTTADILAASLMVALLCGMRY